MGVYYYAFNGTAPFGGLLTGWLCDVGGTELALLVAGSATVAVTLYGAVALRGPARPAKPVTEPAPSEEAIAA